MCLRRRVRKLYAESTDGCGRLTPKNSRTRTDADLQHQWDAIVLTNALYLSQLPRDCSRSVSQPLSDGLDTRLRLRPVEKWSESESRTGELTADPTQHLPAVAVADLWSESTDWCGCNIFRSAYLCQLPKQNKITYSRQLAKGMRKLVQWNKFRFWGTRTNSLQRSVKYFWQSCDRDYSEKQTPSSTLGNRRY